MPAHRPIVKLTAFCWLVSFLAAPVWAQNPAAPTEAEKQGLESFLKWHEEAGKIKKLKIDFKVTQKDNIFNEQEKYSGSLFFLKKKNQVDTKRNLYINVYDEKNKPFVYMINEIFYKVSQDTCYPQIVLDNTVTSLVTKDPFVLFGMKIPYISDLSVAKLIYDKDFIIRNFSIKLVKVDNFYFYLELLGKSSETMGECIQIVLFKSNHFPRRIIYYYDPNKQQWTCDISKCDLDPELTVSDFPKPTAEFFGNRKLFDLNK